MPNRKIVASEIAILKDKVKKEMQRRRGTNPIDSYAGSDYDFVTEAVTNNPLKYEHVEKNHIPLSKITLHDIPSQMNHIMSEEEFSQLEVRVESASKISLLANPGDCTMAVCTGLCYSGCYSACTACTGCTSCTSCTSCSGCSGCSGCGGACSHGCSGCSGCGGSCSGGCSGGCSGCTSCKGCDGCTPCTSCRGCNGCADTCGSGCSVYCSDPSYMA